MIGIALSNKIIEEVISKPISYRSFCKILQNWYGIPAEDYYVKSGNGKLRRNNHIGRGQEGLQCHHICEDLVPGLSDPKVAADVIMELLSGGPEVAPSKGRYLVVCNGVALCSRLEAEIKINNDFESMMRSRVFYVPSKKDIKGPFCKLQKFSFEHEYRFTFPRIHQPYTFHLKPIPGMIFDLEDECRVIYNNINQVKL